MKWINAHQDSIYCSAKSKRPGAMIVPGLLIFVNFSLVILP